MLTRFSYLLKFVLAFSDLVLLNGVFIAAGLATDYFHFFDPHLIYWYFLPIVNLLWLLSAGTFRLYADDTMRLLDDIYRATMRSGALHALLFSLYLYLTKSSGPHMFWFIILFHFLFGIALVISRLVGTYIQQLLIRHFRIRKTVAIIGRNEGGRQLARYFRAHESDYAFEGYLSKGNSSLINDRGEVTNTALEKFQQAVDKGIQEVYVSLPPQQISKASALLDAAEQFCLRVRLVPDLKRQDDLPYEISVLGPVPVISIRQEPAYDVAGRFKKRLFDLLFSTFVIVFVLSWLYPIIAILIKLQSPGPVLFKQLRSGRDNKPFTCYKFRSMRVNNDSDKRQATRDDDRITRIGQFLRRTSLDELPQFLNVWLGDMSVVGPRPHMLKHTEQYSSIIEHYMVRQFLKPGITGWAQVNGYRGETTHPRLMERRVAHDIWYLENWTAMLDVRIVFLTIINMLAGEENAH